MDKEILRENFGKSIAVVYHCIENADSDDFDHIMRNINTMLEEVGYGIISHINELPPKEYFASQHWTNIEKQKLTEQPTCEGCGNKAYKVFKKTWADKGCETMDSVFAICGKCKVVDGEVISFKDVKESIDKEHLKEAVDEMVATIIADKAKQELSKKDGPKTLFDRMGGYDGE